MVLLVVDIQEQIIADMPNKAFNLIANVKRLINTARDNDLEVIYVRHDDGCNLTKGTVGFEIYSEIAPQMDEKIFDKYVNSAFRDTGLVEYLGRKNEKDIMIVGFLTDFCIDATIKCGFEHGYHMIVPEFCNSTFDNEYMGAEISYDYYNKKIWNTLFADCISLEKAIELLNTSN